ncbi:MAG: WxL domain-containing protein [Oscillospiraceae bacterium]|nr:WxL domain-containing protein [Oscillospiraceae bacterium]
MKKILIALITTLALLMAIAPIVLADDGEPAPPPTLSDDSQAEVTFLAPSVDEGVKPDPDGGINGLSYDFAERTVSFQNESYSAVNPAYMRVTSTLPWTVSVSITPFVQAAAPTMKTIEGFTINLNPSIITNHHPGASGSASVASQVIGAADGGGNPVPVGTHGAISRPIAQGTMGIWNLQIPAVLNVLGNTAHVGGATAEINWIFVQTTP